MTLRNEPYPWPHWDGKTVKQFDKVWGVTHAYLDYYIVGFETKEDAEQLSEAFETICSDAMDAALSS